MPVTARLSQRFYERFGDDVANELVDWFNAVDSTYQSQLREINDLNWARIENRFAASEARVDARLAALETRIVRWMFMFWTATIVPILGLELALHGVFRF